jgi:hypothetical protein
VCGTLAWRHWGQMLRAGMLIFHALARRLRDLDLEVFFFGTATVWQYYTLSALPPPQRRCMRYLEPTSRCSRRPRRPRNAAH